MVYQRFVEVGRVAMINYGPNAGKLCVIVDMLDQSKALVDGPSTNVSRQAINYERLTLTDFKLTIPHSLRTGGLKKAFDEAEILKQFEATAWARKLSLRQKKSAMSDFDRFKAMLAKKQTRRVLIKEIRNIQPNHKK